MRIATWNVNSLRSRIARVESFLERHDVDVLALQETKAREDQVPLMGLQSMGYEVAYAGTNQWNGVALLSRVGLEDVEVGFPGQPGWGDPAESEARAVGATCGGVRVWSLSSLRGYEPQPPRNAGTAPIGALRSIEARPFRCPQARRSTGNGLDGRPMDLPWDSGPVHPLSHHLSHQESDSGKSRCGRIGLLWFHERLCS